MARNSLGPCVRTNPNVLLECPYSVFEFLVFLAQDLVLVFGLFLLLATGVSAAFSGRVVLFPTQPILFVFDYGPV